MIRLISGTMPKVEYVQGGWYLTLLDNEEGLYTRDQPYIHVKRASQVTYRDTAAKEREYLRVPVEAVEQEYTFQPEAGLWEYVWTWYEVTAK